MFHELHSRSFVKSVTWFSTAITVTFLALLVFVHDWKEALIDAFILQLIKFLFFYFHERIWNKSNFGQKLHIFKGKKLGFEIKKTGSKKTTK